MVSYFLVDTENVGVRKLPYGNVYYFVNSNYEINTELDIEEDRFIRVPHHREKNALDYCISAFLGGIIKKYGASKHYYVVSRDKGYEVIVDFCRTNMNASIARVDDYESVILTSIFKDLCKDFSVAGCSDEMLDVALNWLIGHNHGTKWIEQSGYSNWCRYFYERCQDIKKMGKSDRKTLAFGVYYTLIVPVCRNYEQLMSAM